MVSENVKITDNLQSDLNSLALCDGVYKKSTAKLSLHCIKNKELSMSFLTCHFMSSLPGQEAFMMGGLLGSRNAQSLGRCRCRAYR